MKAAVQRRFGSPDVVTVDDVPRPAPRDDEVLVRIHAATIGVVDGLACRGSPLYARIHFGLSRPRFAVLGTDFAGQIQATGPAVTRFAVRDQVFGTIAPRFSAHAEYVCLSEHAAVAPKAANLTYAEAAALTDATALCFLRDKANLQRGQSILINGASGAVGTTAVQLARHFGAAETIREEGTIAAPAGRGRVGFVAARDVAAVAAQVLTSPGHDGAMYVVTGPEALGYADIAARISTVFARQVDYEDQPAKRARELMLASGMSPWEADGNFELFEWIRDGGATTVTDTVREVTGAAPQPIQEWLSDSRASFVGRPPDSPPVF